MVDGGTKCSHIMRPGHQPPWIRENSHVSQVFSKPVQYNVWPQSLVKPLLVSSVCHWWVSFCPRAGAPHPEIILYFIGIVGELIKYTSAQESDTGGHGSGLLWSDTHWKTDSVVLKNAKNSL